MHAFYQRSVLASLPQGIKKGQNRVSMYWISLVEPAANFTLCKTILLLKRLLVKVTTALSDRETIDASTDFAAARVIIDPSHWETL